MGELGPAGSLDEELQYQQAGVEDPAWLRVIELGSLCCVPMAIKACIELHVLDILSKHRRLLSAADIVSDMNIFPASNPRAATSLDRILRVLASHGVLTSELEVGGGEGEQRRRSCVRRYGLNEVSKYLVSSGGSSSSSARNNNDNGDGGGGGGGAAAAASLAAMVLMNQDKVFMETWHYLSDAVVDGGEPFRKAHGTDAFSYAQHDLRLDQLFNSAMADHTQLLIQSLLDTYSGFDNVASLVDVGGGFGVGLSLILSKHPHIKAINFDQPHVIQAAPHYPGVENVGGDMFVRIPNADAIFMKWILHDWSDEDCVKLLENCYNALPNEKGSGKVILLDALLPSAVESNARARVAYHLDILMLAYNQGGRERTHTELQTISKLAGFARMEVVCKLNECTIVELYKI